MLPNMNLLSWPLIGRLLHIRNRNDAGRNAEHRFGSELMLACYGKFTRLLPYKIDECC